MTMPLGNVPGVRIVVEAEVGDCVVAWRCLELMVLLARLSWAESGDTATSLLWCVKKK